LSSIDKISEKIDKLHRDTYQDGIQRIASLQHEIERLKIELDVNMAEKQLMMKAEAGQKLVEENKQLKDEANTAMNLMAQMETETVSLQDEMRAIKERYLIY